MNNVLNQNFKINSIRDWFNSNYFISLYDDKDNNLYSFENIEESAKFFNMKLCNFIKDVDFIFLKRIKRIF